MKIRPMHDDFIQQENEDVVEQIKNSDVSLQEKINDCEFWIDEFEEWEEDGLPFNHKKDIERLKKLLKELKAQQEKQ